MIKFDQIKQVHLEISSLCNARCPLCPRNLYGYPYNNGYVETNLSLENAKKIFSKSFLNQLEGIKINGNYGDIVMNPEGPDIVEYFYSQNPNLFVSISTNGSAQPLEFWTRLAKTPAFVSFCLDGLEDTHKLYRQNTDWKKIIKNATAFIDAGGSAVWKFIKFKHNMHQIDECEKLSKKLGFVEFELIEESTRTNGPVFDKNGKLVHVMGNYTGEKSFPILLLQIKKFNVLLEDITKNKIPKKGISCQTKKDKEIYVSSTGEVYPCCYTGFSPKTFGHGYYHQAANSQLVPLIKNNNALESSLQDCIEWFNEVEKSWKLDNYHSGRLVICDDNCGN